MAAFAPKYRLAKAQITPKTPCVGAFALPEAAPENLLPASLRFDAGQIAYICDC